MKINTNIGALVAYNNYSGINSQMDTLNEQLSSGKRINKAADDPAGFSIATRLKARIDSMEVAKSNIMNAKSLVNVAAGGMSNVREILGDLRALAVRSADTALGSDERVALQEQAAQLVAELDSVVNSTLWQGNKLLDGSANYTFQTGPDAANRTAWQMTNSLYATDLNVVVSTIMGASSTQGAVTVNDEDLVQGGSWVVEFTDSNTFNYTGPGSVSGSGTVGNAVDLSVTAGITFTISAATSGAYTAGDRMSFQATAHVDGNLTGAEQTVGQGTTPPTIGTLTVVTEDNIDVSGTFTATRGASTVAEGTSSLSGTADATVSWEASEQEMEAYKDTTSSIVATWDGSDWSITSDGGYTGVGLVSEAATGFKVDLDGTSAADIDVAIANSGDLQNGDTVAIDLTAGTWTVSGASANVWDDGTNINIDYSGGTTADATMAYSANRWASADQITFTNTAHVDGSASSINTNGVVGNAINLLTDESALASMSKIDTSVDLVMAAEADVGAMVNRFEYKVTSVNTSIENTEAARAELEDADMAEVQMEQTKLQILQQTSLYALQSAMIAPQYILSLFQ
jgi:flagellin